MYPIHRFSVLSVLAASLFPVLVACSGTGKPQASKSPACSIAGQQRIAQMRCPDTECITAVGSSGASLAEAESEAKRRIAEQINSTVRSEVESRRRSVERAGREEVSSDFWSKVVSTTEFTHAHLIRVDAARACMGQGGHIVSAALRRDELARILAAEAARMTPSLAVSQQKSLSARHILPFSSAYSSAQDDFIRLYSLTAQHRAATGETLPGFLEIDARQTEAARHGRLLAQAVRVETRLNVPTNMIRNASGFKAAFGDQLGRRGVLVGPAGDCPTCVVADVRVRAELDPNFRFGPRCELSWDIEVVDPSGSQAMNLGGGRIAAYSNRGNMEDAVTRAWRRMADSAGVAAANLAQLLGR